MKNLKSIEWYMNSPAFVLGIVLMFGGHPWIGIMIWIVSIQKRITYVETGNKE